MADALQPLDVTATVNWFRELNALTGSASPYTIALTLLYADQLGAASQEMARRVPNDVYVQRGLGQWKKDANTAWYRLLTLNKSFEALGTDVPANLRGANVSALWQGIAVPLLYGGAHGVGLLGELVSLINQVTPLVPKGLWQDFLAKFREEVGLSSGADIVPGNDWGASALSNAWALLEESAPGEAPTLRDKVKRKVDAGFKGISQAVDDWGWLFWVGGGLIIGKVLF